MSIKRLMMHDSNNAYFCLSSENGLMILEFDSNRRLFDCDKAIRIRDHMIKIVDDLLTE